MKRQILAAAIVLGVLAPVATAVAQERPAASAGRLVPLSRVLATIAQRNPGKQLNTTMGQSGGRTTYVIQWQLTNGRVVVFTVDAETGQQIG